jgi:predicted methyltransferase
MYNITDYSKKQAKKLNVEIKPSSKKNKKIDVIKNNKVIVSIGDIKYKHNDYPTYIKEKGKVYADERRRLYKIRHKKDSQQKNTAGFYADKILW